jgi:GntR family transcriptional repressor for pyruvate dehydrogenase complex
METTGFSRIKTKTKYSQIIEQILELIQREVYKPGDRLPNERLMAEEMGVSRGALRESLKALIILGIIESRQGDGTYVSSKQTGPDHTFIMLENVSVQRIIQIRRLIEIGCAAEGIDSVTDTDIQRLEERLQGMINARKKENHEEYLRASRLFHSDLAEVLVKEGNEPLQNLMDHLWQATNLAVSKEIYNDYMGGRITEYVSTHQAIIEGLKSRSFKAVKAAIMDHYQSITDQLP